ncbi:Glycosyl transferases group 1 [Marinitoga hydrogenitolerans DSM 16785]|uniref:Glycosyl transferases group 1 n=1 Tax=Marinitoga hydrogenitolerans (strain DSM 16785 / JCM 12826 / AT1271) TaxID=1122195 RepID=A0A1M4Y3B0_MARH1|nr:glycosyltransferase [Marinitoga hydrogenitolerans]SHF00241.1 Glycosyl transferases group 1 [Marinitoga hydrogenitolerans DSM 16785]
MIILIIGYMHPKYDKRVFRTVKSLSKNNKIIYQYITEKNEERYIKDNIEYIPIKYKINVKNRMNELVNRRKLDKKILKIIQAYDYDILYMHHFLASLPITPFKIAKKRHKKIIYDFHEHHPENFLENLTGIMKNIKLKIMNKIVKKQIFYSDKLIFVSDEIRDNILSTLKIKKNYLILKNYSDINYISKEKKKEVSFVGKSNRNLDKEKKVLKKIIKYGFSFKIIGVDSEYFKDIPHEYTSFLPYKKMIEELSKSSFSLISYSPLVDKQNKNYLFSLPNKYYDSIAAETPVIVKNTFISMAKEVEKLKIGVVINPKNVDESVEKILEAYNNYDELLNNIRKHKEKFIWTEDKEEKFIEFIIN